jgi:hypothetical protein
MIQQDKKSWTEHIPTASGSRLMLESFGPALTASHAFTSLSDVVLIGGMASGGDTMARLGSVDLFNRWENDMDAVKVASPSR